MRTLVNRNKNLAIGYAFLPDRKKPFVIVRKGSELYPIGTFTNKAKADFFMDSIKEILNEFVELEEGRAE